MMANFLKKNLTTLILAASFGLNVTLAIILISQGASQDRSMWHVPGQGMGMRGEDFRRPDWGTRMSAMPDSLRPYYRFDDEQIDALRTLREEMVTRLEPLRTEIGLQQRQIWRELQGPEPNIALLDSLTSEIMRDQYRIQQSIMHLILEEREILSPEQYQMFLRLMLSGQFDYGMGGRGDRERGDSDRGRSRGRGGMGPDDGKPLPPPPHF